MTPATPTWLAGLAPTRCAWGAVKVADGTIFDAWVCEIDFAPYVGSSPDSLPLDCRKRSGLVAAADGSMSCAEVEVVRRLRAAGFADAGWLATCGQATWAEFQRPRTRIRDDLEALGPGRQVGVPQSGVGAPDVASLSGPHPIFVECKGTEPLQVNQAAWITAALPDAERSQSFAVVIRRSRVRPVPANPAPARLTRRRDISEELAPELARLLLTADAAEGSERINFRNPIAAHGVAAIEPLGDRIERGQHAAFAVVTLEAIGRAYPDEAIAALRQAADRNDEVRDLALAAAARLRPVRPTATPPSLRRSGVLEDVSAFGRPPDSQGPCQFLTAAGKPCQNPGRYWRDGRWSCSRAHRL